MSGRNGIKIAAVISCIIFTLWLLFSLVLFVNQDSIVKLVSINDIAEESDRIILWASVVEFILSVPIAAACLMIVKEKGRWLPMVLTIVPSVLMPFISALTGTLQNIMTARIIGAEGLVRFAALSSISSWLSYLLNAACIAAAAASAVHFYAVKYNCLSEKNYKEENF